MFSFSSLAVDYEVTNANVKLFSDQYRLGFDSIKSDNSSIYAIAKIEGSTVKVTVQHKETVFNADTYIFVNESTQGKDTYKRSENIKGFQGGTVSFTPKEGDFYITLSTELSTSKILYFYINSPFRLGQ